MNYEFIGQGRNRMVFRRGNYVVKIPLNDEGIHDNYHERYAYLNNKAGTPLARCRLKGDLLIMQYALHPGPLSDETGYIPLSNLHQHQWAHYIDCHQVGYNRFGEIVAYDYGLF